METRFKRDLKTRFRQRLTTILSNYAIQNAAERDSDYSDSTKFCPFILNLRFVTNVHQTLSETDALSSSSYYLIYPRIRNRNRNQNRERTRTTFFHRSSTLIFA